MFTVIDAKQTMLGLYHLEGDASRLPGEYDHNFHIRCTDGSEYLLKISHQHEHDAIVDMQNAVLQTLQNCQPPFQFPVLQQTTAHEWIGKLAATNGIDHLVRLFSYVPGTLMANIKLLSPELLQSLGEQVAQLSLALRNFKHPAANRKLKWDLKQAAWISEYINIISDENDRQCIQFFLNRFTTEILTKLSILPQSIIHGDLNDYNILVNNDRVSGFIDFGDLVETATICELAIALTYAMLDKPEPLQAAADIIKGHHETLPLLKEEVEVLFDLIGMRLCTSVINSALRKREQPDDAYLVISEKPAWNLLRQFNQYQSEDVTQLFLQACTSS